MLTNEELVAMLEKANITTALGGQQSAQDVDKFLSLAIDQSDVLKNIRTETGIVTSRNLHTISLGEPSMTAATEATAPAAADVIAPSLGSAVLTPVEVILPYDVTFDFLRKNVEGQGVTNTLNQEFSKRFWKDTVLVAFNGDDSLAADTRTNKCKRIFDGFVQQSIDSISVHDVEVSGADYLGTIFPNLLAEMPKEYKEDRDALGLFCSVDAAEAYAQQIGARPTAYGDNVLTTLVYPKFRGVTLFPVYGMADGNMILTPRQNLAVGWGHTMTVGIDINNRLRMIYYTIVASLHAKIVVADAVVFGS